PGNPQDSPGRGRVIRAPRGRPPELQSEIEMANHVINVERREDEGKGASRRLRRDGKVPAIVYGGDRAPVSVQLNHEKLWLAQQNEWFYSSILDLSLNGEIQQVLLRDMQRHPYKQQIMHLDFQRVSENEILRA